jgi:hypothetical protein
MSVLLCVCVLLALTLHYAVMSLLLCMYEPQVGAAADEGRVLDMEETFCSVSLDIIGRAVFNYDFGSTNSESPVIKVSSCSYTVYIHTCTNIHAYIHTYAYIANRSLTYYILRNSVHCTVVDSLPLCLLY